MYTETNAMHDKSWLQKDIQGYVISSCVSTNETFI